MERLKIQQTTLAPHIMRIYNVANKLKERGNKRKIG